MSAVFAEELYQLVRRRVVFRLAVRRELRGDLVREDVVEACSRDAHGNVAKLLHNLKFTSQQVSQVM